MFNDSFPASRGGDVQLQGWHVLLLCLAPVAVQGQLQQCLSLSYIYPHAPLCLQVKEYLVHVNEEGCREGVPVLLVLELV